jgi:hypothetical protein
MIRFLISRGHEYTIRDVRRDRSAPSVRVMNYDRLLRARWLRRATYVFSDLDRLSFGDLDIAAEMYLQIRRRGFVAWNNPALFKTRYRLLRALRVAGLNDFDAYTVDEIGPTIKYPVFLRKIRDHRPPLTGLLADREALDRAVDAALAAGVPAEHLVVIECLAEPVRPGVFRKLSAFRIGDAIVPHTSVHDSVWLVKYGQLVPGIEDLYLQERDFLRENPFADHLRRVFDIAGVEYGRADFGLFNGRVQVFEINTNPHLHAPGDHPSATRVANLQIIWESYLRALGAIDSGWGRPVKLTDGLIQPGRVRQNRWVRTRAVP